MGRYKRVFCSGGTLFFGVVTHDRGWLVCGDIARRCLYRAIAKNQEREQAGSASQKKRRTTCLAETVLGTFYS